MEKEDNQENRTIDSLLTKIFATVLKIEKKVIYTHTGSKLTMSEFHILHAVGSCEKVQTMTQIAHKLKISVGALTIAVKKVEQKGYLIRRRNKDDHRIVNLFLTKKGKLSYKEHETFHEKMVERSLGDLTDEEKQVLLNALVKIDDWFANEWNEMDTDKAMHIE